MPTHKAGLSNGANAMKIAISSTGKNLDSQIDPRFGRCQCFIFIDPETMEFEAFDNEGVMASGGRGSGGAVCCPKRGKHSDYG